MVVSTVAVALPLPLYDRYTYAVNGEVADCIQLGQRVVVPFQGRVSVAYVVELNPPEVPNVKLKHVAQILDARRLPSTRYIYRLPNGLPAITRHRSAKSCALHILPGRTAKANQRFDG